MYIDCAGVLRVLDKTGELLNLSTFNKMFLWLVPCCHLLYISIKNSDFFALHLVTYL